MFLLDDILLAPLRGLAAVCGKVHEAAVEDLENQEMAILAALAELHQQLENGRIDETRFDTHEKELLDRLETIQQAGARPAKL